MRTSANSPITSPRSLAACARCLTGLSVSARTSLRLVTRSAVVGGGDFETGRCGAMVSFAVAAVGLRRRYRRCALRLSCGRIGVAALICGSGSAPLRLFALTRWSTIVAACHLRILFGKCIHLTSPPVCPRTLSLSLVREFCRRQFAVGP